MSQFIFVFIQLFATVVWLVVVGRILISWINPTYEGPVARFLFETTEPLLVPIRRVIPSNGTIDFAPLVLLLALGFVVQLLLFR